MLKRVFVVMTLLVVCIAAALPGAPEPAHAQTGSNWRAEFWNNTELRGNPEVTRTDRIIRYNWRYGSPDPRIDNTFFSARWTTTVNFPESGWYRFRVMADDGSRLYIDGVRVWNHWIRQWAIAFGVDVELSAGLHEVRLEYFQAEEIAIASLYWYKLPLGEEGGPGSDAFVSLIAQPGGPAAPPPAAGAPTYTPPPAGPATPYPTPGAPPAGGGPFYNAWRGEYFNNTNLSGSPVLTRDDPDLNFDWGIGSPDPSVPADNFSVRWRRTLPFTAGTYVFTAFSDDGVRVYLDGALIINDWGPRQGQPIVYEQTVAAGDHTVIMEHFEGVGGALARLVIFNKAGGGPGTGNVSFVADRTTINAGECVTLSWATANVQAVFYEGQGVPGIGSRLECLAASYTFRLRVIFLDSTEQEFTVAVTANGAMAPNTGFLTGRLIWQTTGVPIVGAQVFACYSLNVFPPYGCALFAPVPPTVSNANGDFAFQSIPVGNYFLSALLPACFNRYNFLDGLLLPQLYTVTQFNQTDVGVRAANCPP